MAEERVKRQRLKRQGWMTVFLCIAVMAAILLFALRPSPSRRSWRAHQGKVLSLAFSPDGKLLASGGGDWTAKVWSVPEGRLVTTLQEKQRGIYAVAFSPDGHLLASGGSGARIHLWRIPEGNLIATLRGHHTLVRALAFSPDGQLLASGSSVGPVLVWRTSDGKLVGILKIQPPFDEPVALAFSPDSQLLALALMKKGTQIRHLAKRCLVKAFKSVFENLAFSPDGKSIIGCRDSTAEVCRITNGKVSVTLQNPGFGLQMSTLSSDGQFWAVWRCIEADFTVRSVRDGKEIWRGQDLSHHRFKRKLWGLAISLEIRTGIPLSRWVKRPINPYVLALSPDASLLAVGFDDGKIVLWRIQ